jgi:hypothetical protein
MAQRKKAKPKRKGQKDTKGSDEKQSARFIETARKLEVDESGGPFQRLFRSIVSPRPKSSYANSESAASKGRKDGKP